MKITFTENANNFSPNSIPPVLEAHSIEAKSLKICVFCSSSDFVADSYFVEARSLGELLAKLNHHLVFGGSNIGLMGALASATKQAGGKITGVIPRLIFDKNIAINFADELIVTVDLRERKAIMESMADVFIALPGGFGTLEEICEIITLKQLHCHQKPVIFINTSGYYDSFIEFFSHMVNQKFANRSANGLFFVAGSVSEALEYAKSYRPEVPMEKWVG